MNCNYKVKIKDIQNKYQFKIFCKTYDDTEIQGDIETLNSDVEALQKENAYLNSLVNQAFDKKEVEGEELSINDTINAKMEVGLLGNTTQETTTGKNKFDVNNNLVSNTIATSGVTTTINDDGTISTSGTTNRTYINMKYQFELSAGTYIVNGCPNGGSQNGYSALVEYNQGGTSKSAFDTGSGATFTIDTDQTITFYPIRIGSTANINMNNLIFKPMIRLSSITDDTYEPYTNGASPNPDYPQEVHTVTGDNTIVVSNKNLFIGNDIHSGFIVATIGNPVTYLTSSLTNTYQKCCYVKAGQQYTLSRNVNTPASTNLRTSVICDDNDIIIERLDFNSTSNSISFVPNKTGWLYLTSDINATNIQIEKSSTATSFVEHQEQTFQVNLGSIELNGIGDYKDYFYKNGDKWYKKEYIGKVVLDGNITGSIRTDIQNENTICFRTDAGITNILSNSKPISNYFIAINDTSDVEHIRYIGISGYRFQLFLSKQKATTANEVITWLSTHNTEVYYVKETATDIEITDTTLIEQLEELKTAMSYAGQTNISQINDDIPFILKITALASYNSRIVALENAILNANRSTPVKNTRKSNEVIEEPREEVVDDNKDENIIKEEK